MRTRFRIGRDRLPDAIAVAVIAASVTTVFLLLTHRI